MIDHKFKDKLLDLSVSGIYVYDLVQGVNLYINQQYTNLTGFTLEDLSSMSSDDFFGLFHPKDQQLVLSHMEEVISSQQGEIIEIEYRFKKSNGEWMWCLSRDAVFERDNDKKPTQFMGTFIDISRQKELEFHLEDKVKFRTQQLEIKNKELEQFAAMVSHDLQEPLHTIIGLSKILEIRSATKLAPEIKKLVGPIGETANRMSKLIKDLLIFSKIGYQGHVEEVDIQILVIEILQDLDQRITELNADIFVQELPKIHGYKSELRVLFQNLISNALKYQEHGKIPNVNITCHASAKGAQFSIKDNGIGIAEENIEDVFQIFKKLHSADRYSGSGIGLAACSKVINLHKGAIKIESKVGEGTNVIFTLPR